MQVTFARMMEAVKAERSSSETDTSVGEDLTKSRESANKGGICADYRPGQSKRKHRGWNSRRFWRSNNSNSSTQGSASDHDTQESTSSTVHYLVADDAAGSSALRKGHRHLRLSGRMTSNNLQQPAGNDSLLSIIRNISGSNNRTPSTPSSPQISDYEISSSFPTPLSTPGSPAGSLEVISQISIGGEMQVSTLYFRVPYWIIVTLFCLRLRLLTRRQTSVIIAQRQVVYLHRISPLKYRRLITDSSCLLYAKFPLLCQVRRIRQYLA